MYQVVKTVLMILLAMTAVTVYLFYINSSLYVMASTMYIHSIETHRTTLNEQHIYSDLRGHTIAQTTVIGEELIHHKFIPNDTVKPVTIVPEKSTKGYLLLYSIYEEQTNAAKNLWQLQVFAKQVGMQVVEPFAKDSFFTMSGIAPNFSQALRFGDYADKDKWNNMFTRRGGMPLVQWEEFITKAPREMIILHTVKNTIKVVQTPLTIAYDENATVCKTGKEIAHRDMQWIHDTFNVIKTVCYICATDSLHPLSTKNFISSIFEGIDAQNQVTVMIVNWLGIRNTRVHLLPFNIYASVLNRRFIFPPSKRVMTAYEAYIQQNVGDHKYVGIVFRTHHVLYFSPLKGSFANQSKHLLQCSKALGKALNPIRGKWKIFLAYDMGMFGSTNYIAKYDLAPLQKQIFQDVFNGNLQVHEREQILINAAGGITDKGVIAQLEKVIATNADCIILLGPHSTFVQSAAKLYSAFHPTNKCIVSICSEQFFGHKKVDSIPKQFLTD